MTTDTMKERFEAWAIQTFGESVNLTPYVTNCGVMTSGWEYNHPVMEKMRRAYEAAYAQGQRDLIQAMGEPVAYRHAWNQTRIAIKPAITGQWLPLYSLPEGAGK